MTLPLEHYRREQFDFASDSPAFEVGECRYGNFFIYIIFNPAAGVIHSTFDKDVYRKAVNFLKKSFTGAVFVPVDQACRMFSEYFSGGRLLPSRPVWSPFVEYCGTEFRKRVWDLIAGIPYGETRTYGELAKRLGKPGAGRAVGQACNANPLALIVPCHRVVGTCDLGGFAGGPDLKQQLLAMEKRTGRLSG